MCNIAGYVGSMPAAPILTKLIAAQEGFGGGFFSGIATWHEGAIHHAKLSGDLARLLAETDAADLPGTVGIIHSRSNSGGGDSFAHPFTPREEIAYVAQGVYGYFDDRLPEEKALACRLYEAGYPMDSRIPERVEMYLPLPDGTTAHMSDAMANLILSKMDAGALPAAAMEQAFCAMPAEIVGLTLSKKHGGYIAYARMNQPMYVAFAPHGAYLSTTPFAFPEDAGEAMLLPAMSSGEIYMNHFVAAPMAEPPCTVAPITNTVRAAAVAAIEAKLAEGKAKSIGDLITALKGLFAQADSVPDAALAYEIVSDLYAAGRVEFVGHRAPGAKEGLTAPRSMVKLV